MLQSNRLRVLCLSTVSMCLFWWLPLGVNTSRGRKVGPQVNKFEQVSSDYHQILAARGSGSRVPRSHVWGGRVKSPGPMSGKGIPYHVTYSMMHLMLPVPVPTPNRKALLKTLPSPNFFCWR